MMRKYLLIGGAAFVLGAGTMGLVGAAATAKTEAPSRQSYRLLQMFGDVMENARTKYVVPIDEQKMVEAAMNGMLASLDPHSAFLNNSDYADLRDTTRGVYGGLGIEVTQKDGAVYVIAPMEDSPASRVGIQSEDYIVAIDGTSVVGMPLNEAIKKMKGEPGGEITLTIARQKVDPFDVKLKREVIKPKAATSRLVGDYGYLRLGSGFNEKTTEEATANIKSMLAQNPNMKGLVLDLRGNPGGLLDQAVSVSDLFLDGGEVVSQRGRDPKDIERYNAAPGDILNGRPMVVLINSGSASASEIVAGALKDRKRAEMIGLTSFGKGSVQTLIPIRGGVDGALKLTTAKYYTPSGGSIQRTGIAPDLEVAASIDQANALATQAFQSSEATEYGALDASEGKVRRGAHEAAEAPTKAFEEKCKDISKDQRTPGNPECDFQLTRAFDVLRYGSVAATPKLAPPTRMADNSHIPGLINGKVPDKRVMLNPNSDTPTAAPIAAKVVAGATAKTTKKPAK
jgi:carboxyl-terminal processing protease